MAAATYWVLKKGEPYREPPHWGTGRDEVPGSLSQGQALDEIQGQIATLEPRILARIDLTPDMQRLKTLPGVGNILAIVIEGEIGIRLSSGLDLRFSSSWAGSAC